MKSDNLKQFEANIVTSFDLVKEDIENLQDQIKHLTSTQKKIVEVLDGLNTRLNLVSTPKEAPKKTGFVASKTGKSFHKHICPFAKNIKSKSKITFSTRSSALNKGYKACSCVK
jgi:hypothetical protein